MKLHLCYMEKRIHKKQNKQQKILLKKKNIGESLPSFKIKKEDILNGKNIIDLVASTNLFSSKSEIRRAIKNKGIKMNNKTVEDDKYIVSINSFGSGKIIKLSHGKKNHVIIKLVN